MAKIIRLTESDLMRLVKRVIKENQDELDDILKKDILSTKNSCIKYNIVSIPILQLFLQTPPLVHVR